MSYYMGGLMNSFKQYNNVDQNTAKEINLKELFQVIKRRFWIIAVVTILASLIGEYLNNIKTIPLYQSSSRIIIGADPESIKTLQVIIKDSVILDKVINELALNKTAEALAGQISVASVDGSQVVSISVLDSDPIFAAKLADKTAQVFRDEVPNIIGEDYVRLLSGAKVSTSPINQSNNNKLLMAIIGGLVVGIGLAFLMESFDDKIRSVREIELLLGLPVLGRVSKVSKRSIKKKNNIMQIDFNEG
jgi:capsular polysaccharide biosynthesis protein